MPLAMPSSAPEKAVEQPNSEFATYQELADLEHEFDEVEDGIIREQYTRTQPLYAKRRSLISRIENFWSLALELAPQEIDQFVQPSDSGVFADCLREIEVSRFELDANTPGGSPRSIAIRFTFGPNAWFEDEVLEKRFWHRTSAAHGSGLVSEPVHIRWKPGKDLTHGLTDAAANLWKAADGHPTAKNNITKLPEYKKLAALLEENDRSSVSFFTFFAFVSENVFVTADESAAARQAEESRRKRRAAGEEVPDEEDEQKQQAAAKHLAEWEDVEVCPHGIELATVIADEFWPNALKYFVESNQMPEGGDEDMSDLESGDGIESDDDDEADAIDIRGLVESKRKGKASSNSPGSGSPPASKSRKRE